MVNDGVIRLNAWGVQERCPRTDGQVDYHASWAQRYIRHCEAALALVSQSVLI